MTYWDTLTRQRDNRAIAKALSPIMRPMDGEARTVPVLADPDRTIAALREDLAAREREIAELRAELAELRGRMV